MGIYRLRPDNQAADQELVTMTEWGVIGVIVTIAGLFATVAGPMIKLNTAITKLTAVAERLEFEFNEFTKKNADSHRRIWEHNDAQDERLNEHDLKLIEHDSRIKHLEGK